MDVDIEEERRNAERIKRLLQQESMKDVDGVRGRWQAKRGKSRPGGRL